MKWLTAGESHGPAISAIIEGVPPGLALTSTHIDIELDRRRQGYGRGKRMKIENDKVEILSGVRHGYTLGSPIHLLIRNRDHENWLEAMSVSPVKKVDDPQKVYRPRPGHADLAGMLKYRFDDARNVLERASARETAMRVAVGAVAKKFLKEFKIEIASHTVELAGVKVPAAEISRLRSKNINEIADKSDTRCLSPDYSEKMIDRIDELKSKGDTCGGICEIIGKNIIAGLGSYVHWDRKLDAKLADILMSIQAVKGVEVGLGFASANLPGSKVHDEIAYENGILCRLSNNAGGIEGGMTNGEDLIIRVAMKPISTLKKKLRSINVHTKEEEKAHFERSDITAVAACGVVAEAAVASVLMETFLEKFGSDHLEEIKDNFRRYKKYIDSFAKDN